MNSRPQSATSTHPVNGELSSSVSACEAKALPNRSALINTAAILWRERKKLRNITLGGAVLTFIVVLIVPNTYESTVRLMGPDTKSGSEMAMLASVLGKTGGSITGNAINGIASDLLGIGSPGGVVTGVLRSRTVSENIVKKFNLTRVYWVRRVSDARDQLAEHTSISEDRKTGVITITVADHDPHRAADMARAYVDELNLHLNEVNTSAAHRQRVFIDERLKEVKRELEDASLRLSDFSAKNTALDPKEQGKAMVGAVVTLQGQLIATQAELRGLQQMYSDNNVRVRSARARMAELQRQIQDLNSDNDNKSETGIDDPAYPSLRKLPALGVTYYDLYREVRLREAVFETLTEQYELARIEEAKEIPNVKVLDAADLPDRKSGPPRLIITFSGMLLSFCIGSVWVVGRKVWSEIDSDDPRKMFALEVWQDTSPAYSRLRDGLRRQRNGHEASSATGGS